MLCAWRWCRTSSTWVPETRYARNGDVHIAYQVFGEGELTFVGLPGIVSNLEVGMGGPRAATVHERYRIVRALRHL